jgi:homoaconitase/3-isopropylmalate dehydratase large subunit
MTAFGSPATTLCTRTIMKHPKIAAMVNAAEKAKKNFKMTEYQGMNYTIMHTEFVRERAEPGMLILGSDSHTCSAGAVGCLSIGLGVADVTMALSTGETWFKVPESILINFIGTPAFGMSGKDVILYILKEAEKKYGGRRSHCRICRRRSTSSI